MFEMSSSYPDWIICHQKCYYCKKAIICAQKYEYFLTNAEFHLEYSHAHFIVKNIYHISNKEKDDTALEIELHFLPLQS